MEELVLNTQTVIVSLPVTLKLTPLPLFVFLSFSIFNLLHSVVFSNILPHTHTLSAPRFSLPFGPVLTAVFIPKHPSNSPTSHLLLLNLPVYWLEEKKLVPLSQYETYHLSSYRTLMVHGEPVFVNLG